MRRLSISQALLELETLQQRLEDTRVTLFALAAQEEIETLPLINKLRVRENSLVSEIEELKAQFGL